MNRTLTTLALLLAMSSTVHAQDVLSMDRAADEAIAQSPSLMAAVLAARSAQRLVVEQESYYQFMLQLDANGSVGNTPRLALGPVPVIPGTMTPTGAPRAHLLVYPYSEQLDLGAQLSRALPWGMTVTGRIDGIRSLSGAPQQQGSTNLVTTGPGYGFNAQITVSQSLLRGFGETVGYAPLYQARADRAGIDATRDRTASALLRDMLVAYWELWYAERGLEIQRAARDVIQRQRDDMQRRIDLGALAGADALTLDAQLATIDATMASAELTAQTAAATLSRLLGRREASPPSTEPEPPRLSATGTADALERVVEQAPEVIEARARIESARIAATVAGQALMPVLNLSGTFEVLGLGYNDVGQTFSNFGSFTAVQFLGTLTYQTPLDDTQQHMEQERAQIAIQIAEQNYEAARAQALADATSAIQADRAATHRIELTDHAVDIAQRALAAQEERLSLGSGLVIDVLNATQTLRQAELDRARAEVDAQEARVRLLHLLGELLGRFDERAPE